MAQWRGDLSSIDTGGIVAGLNGTLSSQYAPGETLPGGWHPTVAYMLLFVVGEIIVYHLLSKKLNIV